MAAPRISGNEGNAQRLQVETAIANAASQASQAETPALPRPLAPPTVKVESADWKRLAEPRKAGVSSHGGLSVRNAVIPPKSERVQAAETAQIARTELPARPAGIAPTAAEVKAGAAAAADQIERAKPLTEAEAKELSELTAKLADDLKVPATEKKSFVSKIASIATAPFREAAFIARTFLAELKAPTRSEIIEGVAAKAVPFVGAAATWGAMLLPSHPVAFAAAMALSLSLETLHGVFIRSWLNFQNVIHEKKGLTYQSIFNLAYFQTTGAAFRAIAATSIPNTVPPWSLEYWRDMSFITVVGSFFGTLGYNGLDELNKGQISEKTRDRIQQFGRDGFFLAAGMFFGTGAMSLFWPLFIAQQGLDLGLYIAGKMAKTKPGFEKDEPKSDKSATQQALDAVLSSPFIAPFRALFRAVFKRGADKQNNA